MAASYEARSCVRILPQQSPALPAPMENWSSRLSADIGDIKGKLDILGTPGGQTLVTTYTLSTIFVPFRETSMMFPESDSSAASNI